MDEFSIKLQNSERMIEMKILKFMLNLLLIIFVVSLYSIIFIFFNYKSYIIFAIITDILFAGLILRGPLKSSEKKRILSAVITLVIFLGSKSYMDYKSLNRIKEFNSQNSIFQILKPRALALINNKEYEKKFKVDNDENAKIYYTDETEPALDLIHAYLNKAKEDNIKLFGNNSVEPVIIKFDYDKNVFENRNPGFNDYAGLYFEKNKTIYIYIKDCYKDALALNMESNYLRHILLHEYNHHMFYQFLNSNQITSENIPTWFIEGTAEYAGNEDVPGSVPEKTTDLNQLNPETQWTSYLNKGYSVYEESHYAVRWLIHMKGKNVIRDILIKTKSIDFNTAFKQVAGMSLEDLQKLLKADEKNGWEKYNKMISMEKSDPFSDIRIECLGEYIKKNPDNIDAVIDQVQLYENKGFLNKAKEILESTIKKNPQDEMVILRLGLIYERLDDFDNAVKVFEKLVNINPRSSPYYMDLAELYLIKDVNKAVLAAEKSSQLNKSSFVKKQYEAVFDFSSSIKNGSPFEGCLKLIKKDIIHSVNIKKAMIDKLLKEYPNIKNSSRYELIKMKANLS